MLIKFLKNGLLLLLLIYGLAINSYLAIYLACEDCIVLIAQANHVAHWITLSNVLILPLVLLVPGRRWILIWLLPGVIVFVGWYGVYFMPNADPAVAGQTQFRVMTFNVLGHVADPSQTYLVIDALDPDILATQELCPTLDAMLRIKYPYQVSEITQGVDGLGIYSRFPILESEVHIPEVYAVEGNPPPYIRSVIKIDEQEVVVYTYHPTLPTFQTGRSYDDHLSEADYNYFVQLLDEEALPVLVLCDCNTTPRTHQYAQMDQRLDDAFKAQGSGFGLTHGGDYRLDFATIRIDYLWHSDEFQPLHVEVGTDRGTSDHLPVWGDFMLQR